MINKDKLKHILRAYKDLNKITAFSKNPDTEALHEIVNLQLWRVQAMYFGGDCEFAAFTGYLPGQRLWQKGHKPRQRREHEGNNQGQKTTT